VRVLLKVLAGVLVAAVVGWFGYQVYVHLTDARRVDERLQQVSQAWEDDPAAFAAASGGQRVTPATLREVPFRELGAVMIDAYAADGHTLQLGIVVSSCDPPVYGVDVRRTGETLVVLVRPQTPWLPDPDEAWGTLRGEVVACDAVGVPVQIETTLDDDLGDRIVVDAVGGSSVPRAS